MTFVLVHGAWHGSWCWKRVRRMLQDRGHDVFTPTLTGVGERSHLLSPSVTLNTHIDDVVNLICWEELSDVVLCGHSYGGCVISGVADRMPDRIRSLVYLDAFVLENGECLYDVIPAEVRDMQIDGANKFGDGWRVPPIPAEVFHVNAADVAWVNSQCTPQPIATSQQPIRLTGGLEKLDKVTHILAQGFRESPFAFHHRRAEEKGWSLRTVNCGHDVMLDLPADLAQLLLDLA